MEGKKEGPAAAGPGSRKNDYNKMELGEKELMGLNERGWEWWKYEKSREGIETEAGVPRDALETEIEIWSCQVSRFAVNCWLNSFFEQLCLLLPTGLQRPGIEIAKCTS